MSYPYYFALVVPEDFQSGPLMDRWLNRDVPFLEAQRAEAQAKWDAGAWAQPHDGNRQRVLQEIIAALTEAINTAPSRATLTWQDVFETFKQKHVTPMRRWVETYIERDGKAYTITPHPLLVLSGKTALGLAQDHFWPEVKPALSNVNQDTGELMAVEEFTLLPEGRGFRVNEVLPEVCWAIKEATGDLQLVEPQYPGTALDHYRWVTLTREGRACARVYVCVVNGGGWFGGWGAVSPSHPDWATHPEFGNSGLALTGAEVSFRHAVTGTPDPTDMLRGYAWFGTPTNRYVPKPTGESHEYIGHGSSVLCHPNDVTGIYPGDWALHPDGTAVVQTVKDLQTSPCQGNWYGPGQIDQFLRAGEYHLTEIPYTPPLTLTWDGEYVHVMPRWEPLPEGFQLRVNGLALVEPRYKPTASGDVTVEAWGGVGVHNDLFVEKLAEATTSVALPVPEPPPPPPPPAPTLDVQPAALTLRIWGQQTATLTANRPCTFSIQGRAYIEQTSPSTATVTAGRKPGSATVTARAGAEVDVVSIAVKRW